MKIVSWNVNGIRAAHKKGLLDFLYKENADFYCLQEIKAAKDQLPDEISKIKGYFSYLNSAKKRGYSGVLVYTNKKPKAVKRKIGLKRFDEEGRYLELSFSGFTLINIYIPHGGRKKENLEYKLEVYSKLLNKLHRAKSEKIILVGDFNIAHTEKDLANPKQNINNIMFTLDERKQISKLVDIGFVDAYRKTYRGGKKYTWWSYAFKARERNIGWRIDYTFVSENLAKLINKSVIYSKVQGSDHCPIGMELNL